MRKPPDKYKTLKISLKSILVDKNLHAKLFEVITSTNKLVIHVYQFLRLWILHKFHNKQDIPLITTGLIKMAFKSLVKEEAARGPKPKNDNLKLYQDFCDFYKSDYQKLGYQNKMDGKNMSQIIEYLSTDMLTNIENNIKCHFINYIKRYVNGCFSEEHNKILENIQNKKDKATKKKEFRKELYLLKMDIINDTLKCDEKYHIWLTENRKDIVPSEYDKSYYYDIVKDPQKYLPYMIRMNLKLEEIKSKMFQFFPLRTSIYPKYVPIDTKSIIEILVDGKKNESGKRIFENKKEYLDNIEKHKNNLWKYFFNLDHNIFKQKKMVFDYRISTDGFAVSLQFLLNDKVEENKIKKQKMKEGRSRDKTSKDKKDKNVILETKKTMKDKTTKNKKDKEVVLKTKETKKEEKKIEFPFLEELEEEKITELKDKGYLVLDPGKKNLIYMADQNKNYFRYTNRQKLKETKQLKYQRLLQRYKNKNEISVKENELAACNSKSCSNSNFQKYIENKNKVNGELFQKYEHEIFRKYKWYSYINKKRAMDKMLNKIEEKYGKNKAICYGSWTVSQQQRNFIPTPMIGLKRKIAERFRVYTLDEFRTSCLNYKTEEKCENLSLPDKKGEYRSIHAVLTYKMEDKRYGCIQRDKNSVNNMLKIADSWISKKERPLKFRRESELLEAELAKKRIVKSANLGKPMSNSSKPRLKTRDKGAIIPKVLHESK